MSETALKAAIVALVVTNLVGWWGYRRKQAELDRWRRAHEGLGEKARLKAEAMVEEAKNEASRILSGVKIGAEKYRERLDQGVKMLTDKELDEYNKVVSTITEDIENSVINDSKAFREKLGEVWGKLDQQVRDMLLADYQEAKKKITEQAVGRVRELVEKAAPEVLGLSLDGQLDEKLIREAVEKAGREYGV